MDLIECPRCRSSKLLIYEYYHMFRKYPQEEEGIDPERFDEEFFLKDEPLTIMWTQCEHEWVSEEGAAIEDLVW